ncbi:hypothetical protein B0J12DRAFT_788545 [Macrophomina phaseolina]|uniref:Uncharacterized protein n=1 Tax=Macrophomina phaseolina TaxID=35725 RepID=A0ABQ8G037_9PEZI|nr:hypothetical protein B0J12DRAFT_788545 [Macrophomina phaseolina]
MADQNQQSSTDTLLKNDTSNSQPKPKPQQNLPFIEDSDGDLVFTNPRRGRRIVPVHQSRIADRPVKENEKDSSLKIKIELDLEVEVEIYARVKGDVMIGLL